MLGMVVVFTSHWPVSDSRGVITATQTSQALKCPKPPEKMTAQHFQMAKPWAENGSHVRSGPFRLGRPLRAL